LVLRVDDFLRAFDFEVVFLDFMRVGFLAAI